MSTAQDQQSRAAELRTTIDMLDECAKAGKPWPYVPSTESIRAVLDELAAAQVLAMGRVLETWAIYDSEGLYETRDTEESCKSFCDHYNARDKKLGGGLGPYTYKALYAAAPWPPAAQEKK